MYSYKICDWASENRPSGHTKFDHIFHICCIITNALLMLCKYNFQHQYTILLEILYSLQNVNIVHRTQDIYHYLMWCILCPLDPFSLGQSHYFSSRTFLSLYLYDVKLQPNSAITNEVMLLQIHKIGCMYKTSFHKSSHIIV